MMIYEFSLMVFALLHAVSSGDCRWHNSVEFWSNVVCSMENIKTVRCHVLGNSSGNSILLEQYFQALIYEISRKCRTTIALKIYTLRDSENLEASVSNDDVAHRAMKRPSIWEIKFSDVLPTRMTLSSNAAKRSDKTFDKNTWNVHVILARDIRSFDQISKDGATFEWNSHDRFIVLIARFPGEHELSNESNSRIDDILKALWSERKVQKIFVSEATLVNDTVQIDRIVRTYNPFAKVNDSAWGVAEIINVMTAEEASNVLSRLAYRRIKNMNGYELKVGYFAQGQTLKDPLKVQSSTHYDYADVFKGFDEIMLNTIARDMNFQVDRIHPTDNKSYGSQLSNGTYVGAIASLHVGDVVHGRTDMCIISFFVKKYSTTPKEDVDFSTYVDFDKVCVVVPKATRIPKGIRIYHFFPLSIWICSLLTNVLTYLIWYYLQVFTPRRIGRSYRVTIYRSFLLSAGCPQKLPDTNAERILLTGILLANITLVGLFSGNLYKSFAHDMYYPDIDNLYDFDASGLKISLTSASLADVFDVEDDDVDLILMRNLQKKMQFGINAVRGTARYRNISAFARKSYFPIITEEMTDVDGGPLLHLIKECPGKFYLSYLLPKNSIFTEKVNELISQLNQAGLPTLWNQHIVNAFIVQKKLLAEQRFIRKGNKKETNVFVPFNLSDVQSAFYMLLIGLSISTIVFFHEKGWLKIPLLHSEKLNCKSTR